MNSPVRSLDKPKNCAAYLRFGLKQNWQQLVFYGIVMLLACVVTCIIGTVSVLERLDSLQNSTYYPPEKHGADLFRNISLIFAIVSCVLGVFSGMASTGYVNSRRAIHCYHSLPLTRDTLYLQGSAVQILYYLVCAAGTMLLSTLCIAGQLGMAGPSVGAGLYLILVGVGGYLLVFSLFQLAGTLTGTAVFRFIAAAILSFLPVLVYLMIYVGADSGMPNILVDFYLDYDHIRFLCPAFNLFYVLGLAMGEPLHSEIVMTDGYILWSIATIYLTAGAYYLLGLWLHRKRRSELSESSLIWKKLTGFVKYPVIFVCGAGGAVFFRSAMGSDIAWTIFGAFCGLVLSFLLMNVLISRNTKRMFSGLPGLGLTALAAALFLAVFPFDVCRLNHFMYRPEQVKSVTVYYGSNELTFTEADDIAVLMSHITELTRNINGTHTPYDTAYMNETAFYIDPASVLNQSEKEAAAGLTAFYADRGVLLDQTDNTPTFIWMSGTLLDTYEKEEPAVVYYDDGTVMAAATQYYDPSEGISGRYNGDYSYDWNRLEFSVYPKFGIPIHRYVRISEISAAAAMYDLFQEAEAYQAQYRQLEMVSSEDLYSVFVELPGYSMYLDTLSLPAQKQNDPVYTEVTAAYNRQLVTLVHAAAQMTPAMTDTPVIGHLRIHTVDREHSYALYAGMNDFWDAWLDYWEAYPDFLNHPQVQREFNRNQQSYYDMLRYTNYRLYENGEDILEWMASFHRCTYIIEADTGRAMYVEEEQMAQVLADSMLREYSSTGGQCDTRYMIVSYTCSVEAAKEGIESTLAAGKIPDGYAVHFFFRKDAVPAFVTDAFGGT